jgi:XTP/dITP diphosphohydrolase
MAETDLLLASMNPGKLQEMKELVAGLPFRVFCPVELGIRESPEETGSTFIENAILKARHYARRSGRLTVADDSGLSVDALDGGPGLYSSRFGGPGATDADRNRLPPGEAGGRAGGTARRALHERGGGGPGR